MGSKGLRSKRDRWGIIFVAKMALHSLVVLKRTQGGHVLWYFGIEPIREPVRLSIRKMSIILSNYCFTIDEDEVFQRTGIHAGVAFTLWISIDPL